MSRPIRTPRRASRRAEIAGLASPAGLAGLAAFLCGEAIGPRKALQPPPIAAANAIAGCIHLTADADEVDAKARYADHVARGLELADQIELWSQPDTHGDNHGGGSTPDRR